MGLRSAARVVLLAMLGLAPIAAGSARRAGLAFEDHPRRRAADRGQRHRPDRTRRARSGRGGARPADHHREPSRRRQHARHGAGRAGGRRRIHAAGQLLVAFDRAGDLCQPAVRYAARPHRGGPARQHADRARGVALEGLQDARRPCCRRQGEARRHELLVGRRRQFLAFCNRGVPARGRLPGRACAQQGRAGGDHRGPGRAHRLLLLAAPARAVANPRRQAAGSGGERLPARGGDARGPDHGRSGFSGFGVQFLGRRVRTGEDAGADPAAASRRSARKPPRRRPCRNGSPSSASTRCS